MCFVGDWLFSYLTCTSHVNKRKTEITLTNIRKRFFLEDLCSLAPVWNKNETAVDGYRIMTQKHIKNLFGVKIVFNIWKTTSFVVFRNTRTRSLSVYNDFRVYFIHYVNRVSSSSVFIENNWRFETALQWISYSSHFEKHLEGNDRLGQAIQ